MSNAEPQTPFGQRMKRYKIQYRLRRLSSNRRRPLWRLSSKTWPLSLSSSQNNEEHTKQLPKTFRQHHLMFSQNALGAHFFTWRHTSLSSLLPLLSLSTFLTSQKFSRCSNCTGLTDQALLFSCSAENFLTVHHVLSVTAFCIRIQTAGRRLTP